MGVSHLSFLVYEIHCNSLLFVRIVLCIFLLQRDLVLFRGLCFYYFFMWYFVSRYAVLWFMSLWWFQIRDSYSTLILNHFSFFAHLLSLTSLLYEIERTLYFKLSVAKFVRLTWYIIFISSFIKTVMDK